MENIEILHKILGNLPNTVILLTIATALWYYFKKNSIANIQSHLDLYAKIEEKNRVLIQDLYKKIDSLEKDVARYKTLFEEIRNCTHIKSCPILKAEAKQVQKKK